MKLIFSFLKTNSFLNIISYSKEIQSKLDITPNNYKRASNFYIKKEENITKIFIKDSNQLIFEGKFEKGQKIEGKEYKLGKLYFSGKYNQNMKYKGTTFYKNGKLMFKGEYNKGLFWSGDFFHPKNTALTGKLKQGLGTISEYSFNGFLIFTGEYKNGFRFSGIEYNNKGKKIFEGEYKNNLRWNGKFYSPDEKLVTQIKEGNGTIEEYYSNEELIFKGELKNGRRFCGTGQEYYDVIEYIKLEVEYKNYNYISGILYNMNGCKVFEGKFVDEKKSEGIYYQEKDEFNFTIFYGQFNEGRKHKGIEITYVSAFIGEFDEEGNYNNGKYYQGEFEAEEKKQLFEENNLKELNIEEIENKGQLKFVGEFKNQRFYKGKEYKYDQVIFEGEYKNGLYWNGKGYQIKDEYTNKMEGFEGTYKNGAKRGKEVMYDESGNLLIEKTFKDEKNWDYVYYGYDEILNGEVINGNSDYVIEYKIDINEEINYGIKKMYKYYEGSYRNNQKYIGKEYDANENLIFEGEYKEGKYYFGKEYYKDSENLYNEEIFLKFEGQFKNRKYYKGKEYYNKISEEIESFDQRYDFGDPDQKLRLKFEGLYKDGNKYIGWEYNLSGELIFVGEFKSAGFGTYYNGYFYKPGKLLNQEKAGFIKNGIASSDIIYYDKLKQWKFYGNFFNSNSEYLLKDIALNEPYEKKIEILTSIKGLNTKRYSVCKEYIINGFSFRKTFEGEYIDERYYNGKELMYHKKNISYHFEDYIIRIIRIYNNGKIKECTTNINDD